MELLNFIFRLGVVFAIFGFLFGLFEIGLMILQTGRVRSIWESYTVKLVKYLFLVSVTFMFCMNLDEGKISPYHFTIASCTLLIYFVGKLQSKQEQQALFAQFGKNIPLGKMGNFSLKAEIAVISISIALFVLFLMFPFLASNKFSLWFHDSILNIEDTPVFGFIFKIIGFFFVVNMIMKVLNGITLIMSGRAFVKVRSGIHSSKDDDKFDDFEEMN
ncbi:MAG: hypothetical protein V4638_02840 [Bacteroidota bacterium]